MFSFLFCYTKAKSSKLSITAISLSQDICILFGFNMILALWITFNILRSSQMNKEQRVKSELFISLIALPFHKELQLINYQDLTQDILFI